MAREKSFLTKLGAVLKGETGGTLSRIMANAGWLTAGRLLADLLNMVFFVVLARTYGPDGIGQYAYAQGVAGLIYAGVNLGIEDFAVRECARVPTKERGLFVGRLLVLQAGTLVVVGLISTGFFTVVQHSKQVVAIITVLSLQQICFAVSKTLFAPAYASQKMVGPAVADFVFRSLGVIAGCILVWYLEPPIYLAVSPVAVAAVGLLFYSGVSAIGQIGRIDFDLTWKRASELVRTAWPFAGSLILSYVSLRASFIVMRIMLGDGPTGLYASAVKILEAAVLPLTFLGFAAYPRLSALFESSKPGFWSSAERLLRVSLIAGALVAWSMLFIGAELIVPLFGERFGGSEDVVRSLALLAILTGVSVTLIRVVLARDRQHVRLMIQLMSVLVLLPTTVLGIAIWGIYGAVVASYLGALTAVVLYVKVLGIQFRDGLMVPASKFLLAVGGGVATWVTVGFVLGGVWVAALTALVAFLAVVLFSGFAPEELLRPFQKAGARQ